MRKARFTKHPNIAVRFGAGKMAFKFGQQKINIHEYGR